METKEKTTAPSRFGQIFSGDKIEEVKTEKSTVKKSSKKESPEEKVSVTEKRTTLEMPSSLHEKLKIMAHWELTGLKEIITSSLEKTVEAYDKEHGELKKVPKSQRNK